MSKNNLPETGYVRITQLIGNAKAEPPIPAIFPFSKSTLWAKVKSGTFPAPVKLGPRITAWRVKDIRAELERGGEISP
jgi:hypothetical protein